MKKKSKKIFVGFLLYGVCFICSFLPCCFLLDILNKFGLTSLNIVIIPSILGIIVSLYCFIYNSCTSRAKKEKMQDWLIEHIAFLILLYVFFIIFLGSVKKEVIWNFDDIKDIISLQWVVFGISITAFVVWRVLFENEFNMYLVEPAKESQVERLLNIYRKQAIKFRVDSFSFSVYLLLINVLVIIMITAYAYLANQKVTLVVQDLVIFSFLVCTNTICNLVIEIVKPILIKKKELKDLNSISKEDLAMHYQLMEKIDSAANLISQIKDLESLDYEEKYCAATNVWNKLLEDPIIKEISELQK